MADQQSMADHSAQAAEAQGYDGEEDEEEYAGSGQRFLLLNAVPSWLVSSVVHGVLLMILAIINLPPIEDRLANELTVNPASEDVEEFEELDIQEIVEEVTDAELEPTDMPVTPVVETIVQEVTEQVSVSTDVDMAAVSIELTTEFSDRTAPRNDLMQAIGAVTGTGLSGRGAASRSAMVKKYGGTKGSEDAVALALQWIANHQMPDGGWQFNHAMCPTCGGQCSHPGEMTNGRVGATALALLPFLGSGMTHTEGKFQRNVQAGLYFLGTQMKPNGDMTDGGGRMYSHGLAAIVLCEAYAMTHDKALLIPAQKGINFIVYAQDPIGGGWRYTPRQPGDTSAVGWQLMALKSGHMAYLQVPGNTVRGASAFLDAVQSNSGANYGYTGPGSGQATSAVGLLCRMYLGWKREHPGIQKGAEWISQKGPSTGNMYYNYYATQVMRHFEGDMWDKWNVKMRDYLVAKQSKSGHEAGSWHLPGGDHGSHRGGRLYVTAMATMILEVYYRHMPIYGKQAAEDEFPL